MYQHFRIPAEFVLERTESVTHSFGSYMDDGPAYGDQAYRFCHSRALTAIKSAGPIFYAKTSRSIGTRTETRLFEIHEAPDRIMETGPGCGPVTS